MCVHIYIYIHTYTIYTIDVRYSKKKEKQIIIGNILTTAFINSFLSTNRFSLMIHFITNLQVIININEPDNSDH